MKTPVAVLVCSIILTFLLSSVAFTQTQWAVFDSINAPLQTNLTKGIKTDSYGNVWIGTNNGLYKYDGVFWNNYNTNNSQIPYNQIYAFFLDRNDNIWFPISELPYPYFVKFDGANWEYIDSNQTCFANRHRFAIDGYETKWVWYYDGWYDGLIIRYDGFSCIEYDQQDIGINTTDNVDFEIDIDDNFFFIAQAYEFNEIPGIARTTQTGWLTNELQGLPIDFTINIDSGNIWICLVHLSSPTEFLKLNYDSLQVINSYEYYNPGLSGIRYGVSLISDQNGNVWQSFKVAPSNDDDLYMGLLCFLINSEEWILFDENNSPLPSNVINGIEVDIYNSKWVATDNGLAAFNEEVLILPTQITTKDTLNFGEVLVDSIVTESLIVYNTTTENLQIDSIEINLPEFSSIVSLPVTVPVGDSLIISIKFHPEEIEEYTGKLTLFTNRGMYIQVLSGNGVLTLGSNNSEPITMDYYLGQNYPNPFNPITTIPFYIPGTNKVNLIVYDVLGNKIFTLVNEERPGGEYNFKFDATGLPSGIYFYRLQAGKFRDTKKMVLSK
jgi:hypothetical protein